MRSTYEAAWAGAETLKHHCHHIIQTLGPATPPEVFLYRGNAYYALGFPYLALADYENASRFLSLSPLRHQEKCWKSLKHFPMKQEVLYAGTNSHVHLCVTPFLDAKTAVQTLLLPHPTSETSKSQDTDVGTCVSLAQHEMGKTPSKDTLYTLQDRSLLCRKVMAVASFSSAGMPVMKVIPSSSSMGSSSSSSTGRSLLSYEVGGPWLQYPLFERHCSRCGVPLYEENNKGKGEMDHASVTGTPGNSDRSTSSEANENAEMGREDRHAPSPSTPHANRKRVFPCTNPKCSEEYCSRDCRQLALQEYHSHVCTNEEVQGIEIDLFTRMQQTEEVLEHRELATMLLTLRVLYTALSSQSSPTALPQMRILSGRASFSPHTLCGSLREEFHRIADALHVLTSISYEEFIGVYTRVWCNAHWVAEEEEETPATASAGSTAGNDRKEAPSCESISYKSIQLHLPYAMFNHSCDPNLIEGVVHPPFHAGARSSTSLSNAFSVSPIRTLVTSRPIQKGEELTRSYFPLSWLSLPYAERSAAMKALDFTCQCPRCVKKE